jgi:uncharacterized protein
MRICNHITVAWLSCAALLADPAWLQAQPVNQSEQRGLELMRRNYAQMSSRNWRSDVVMHLSDTAGNIQTRHLQRISKTDDKDQEKFHLRFVEPPSIRNTTLLIIEHKERETQTEIWFYLPAIKKVQRIAGANLRTSYMGTEFSFKDLKRERVDAAHNRYAYVGDETLDGVPHHIVDAFPISEEEMDEQGYQRRRIWLRDDNALATRIDFFDEQGSYLKTMNASEMRRVSQSGKMLYTKLAMTNRKGIKTVVLFNMLRLDEEDPDDLYFTKNYLMKR